MPKVTEQPLEVGKLYRLTDHTWIGLVTIYGRYVMVTYCLWLSFDQHLKRLGLGEDPISYPGLAPDFGYSISYLHGKKEINLFIHEEAKVRAMLEKKV